MEMTKKNLNNNFITHTNVYIFRGNGKEKKDNRLILYFLLITSITSIYYTTYTTQIYFFVFVSHLKKTLR